MRPATETERLRRNQTAGFASDSTSSGGKLIVLTAPLTETIDHAGYFIQMALASLPKWLEFVLNKRYPNWREVERNEDGSARYMPAGVRVLEKSLLREYATDEVVACFPDDLDKFIGPKTRVVAVSTHNPLGVTFAAGVYTSIYGSSKEPLNLIHPTSRDAILFPDKRTTFGVVEMTTGCGRRCQFCVPDLNPQIDMPKARILDAVRANVRQGNKVISLATEDMFIWGQVHTDTPFFFPNREALVDLYTEIVNTPGVEHHLLSHCTMAPFVVDPELIRQLSEVLLPKSPMHLPLLSSHPQKKALIPLIGLETGSVRMARQIMPSKGVPFSIDDWPSVVLEGLRVANQNNWFPMMTLMVGNPGETDQDVQETLDLVYEMERCGLFAFLIPSIFTPLHDTRMEHQTGVTHTRQLSPLQWQLLMKCWKHNLRPGQYSWWGPIAWRVGSLFMWLYRLRKLNGPNFTWPLMMFAGLVPERILQGMGKIHAGKPVVSKTRRELIASLRRNYLKHLRADNGDLPESSDRSEEGHPDQSRLNFEAETRTL